MDIKKDCTFLKPKCCSPNQFFSEHAIPPRHIIFKHIAANSLLDFFLSEVTQDLINTMKQKQKIKFLQKTSISDDITNIQMKFIKKKSQETKRIRTC